MTARTRRERENCHNVKYDKNCYTNLSNWKRSLDCLPIYGIGRYNPSDVGFFLLEEEIKFNVLELLVSTMLTVSEKEAIPSW